MKKSTKLLFAIFIIIQPVNAATLPENGWWWNPDESGYGYNIEAQKDIVFVATFIYDDTGKPIWYSGSGELIGNTVNINLMRSNGGPCLTCNYMKPVTNSTGHHLRIVFESASKATALVDDRQIPLQRFNYAYGQGAHKLEGLWLLSIIHSKASEKGNNGSYIVAYDAINNVEARGFVSVLADTTQSVMKVENSDVFVIATPISQRLSLITIIKLKGLNKFHGIRILSSAEDTAITIENKIKNSETLIFGHRMMIDASPDAQVGISAASYNQSSQKADRLAWRLSWDLNILQKGILEKKLESISLTGRLDLSHP